MAELYLPSSLVDELAEERIAAAAARQQSVEGPVWFQTQFRGTTVLGQSPTAQQLLEEQRGWAQIANRAIEDRVGSLVWFIGDRRFDTDLGKWITDPLPQHPANRMLRRPNPIFSGKLTKMLIAGLVAQTGAAYLQKIRDGLGMPVQLWPLPTQHTRPIAAEGKVIGGYEVTTHDGATVILPEEDVIRIWRPDLRTLYGELGFLGPQAIEYDAQKSMNEQKRSYFDRDATPRTALLAEPNEEAPGKKETDRFKALWRQSYDRRSGSERGIPAFIPPGFKLQELTEQSNSQDVPLDERWSKQIMASYGVPQFAVGIDTNVNRATGETTMWAWDQNSIEPMTDLIADAFTTQMMETDFGEGFVVAFEDFVAPDKDFELRAEKQGLDTGKIVINEARKESGMDDATWGDLPRGTIADEPYTGEPSDPFAESASDLRAGGVAPPSTVGAPLARSFNRGVWTAEATWARNVRVEQRFTRTWARTQSRIWEAQLEITLRRFAKVQGVDFSQLESGRSQARSITVEDIFSPFDQTWSDLFDQELGPLRETIYGASAKFAHDAVPITSEFFLSPAMQVDLQSLGATSVVNIDMTTARHIGEQLAAGQGQGESLSQLARRIEGVFRRRSRARTVARTEIGISNQAGTAAGLKSSGVVEKKVWNTSRDGAVRDSHRIDGQTVPMDQNFILLDGDMGPHPLARSLRVGNVVECRCFMTPLVEGIVDTSDPDQPNEG